MVSAIYRRVASEQGVWGVIAAAGTAAVLLAALALALDFTALDAARTEGQAALDDALRAAAHDVAPMTVVSQTLELDPETAQAAAIAALQQSIRSPLSFRWVSGPEVLAGPPAAVRGQIDVLVPMPALLGSVSLPVSGEEAIGWLPH